ncbi:MAG: acyl-ACP--UDP-N-acetylglucosamine O-acyltransferase [Polyangiaceae bacterium]
MTMVHGTAIVHPRAKLGKGVEVGPYCLVGEHVTLGAGCKLMAHVVIDGHTYIGDDNEFHPFAAIGGAPQRRPRHGETRGLRIGSRNVFREAVTVHVGTQHDTEIGDEVLLMAGAHIAHDATIGSFVTIANGVQIAGHVVVDDYVTFGGLAGVAQRKRIGESAFVAAGAMCERDVPPFVIVQGDRARVRALNEVGLERRGLDKEDIEALRVAFRALFVTPRKPVPVSIAAHPLVQRLIASHGVDSER